MDRYIVGGILGALVVLRDHWGAVGSDLARAGYVWNDICTDRLPLDQFVQFVLYAPPSTAVFHRTNEGWTATTHKVTDLIQWLKVQMAMGTEDPEAVFRELGDEGRPGAESVAEEPMLTIGEYMRLAGMEGADD